MTYPSDLTDKQWELIKDHFDTKNYKKSRKHSQRNMINAVFYSIKTGCQCFFCPKIFQPIRVYTAFTGELNKKEYGKKPRSQLQFD